MVPQELELVTMVPQELELVTMVPQELEVVTMPPLELEVVTMPLLELKVMTMFPMKLEVVTMFPMELEAVTMFLWEARQNPTQSMTGKQTQKPGLVEWEATCPFPGVTLMLTRFHGLWMMQCLLASCVSMVSLLTLLELHVSNVIP